jgi:hypothetical protein
MPLDEINKKRLADFGKEESYLYPSEDIAKDYSKYEDYLGKSTPLPEPEWDDARAKSQSGFEKVLNSTGQMVGTFGTAIASTAATLVGGAVGLAAETADLALEGDQFNGMDIALNNPIMQGISNFDKYLKEDLFPTYYTKEQQNSLLSAATGTDLLNGIGFMASAMLPAAYINKTLGGLAKMASIAKAGKLEPILDAAFKAGKISNIERQLISKTALHLDKAGPITGALVGRIGESAMEANGVYENLIANGASEEEAKDLRNKDFMGNMALAVSDVAQYTRWFRGGGLGERLIKDGLKTVVKERGKGALLKDLLFEAGQEAGEEGYQFLLQKGAENSAKGKSYLEGISEASGDLFGTIEGQKSMLLGAILGGGMSSIANVKDAKENKARLQQMANNLTANADTTQRYITDPETGKKIVNPELTKIATQFAFYEQLKDQALAEGDKDAYDVLEKTQFADLVAAKLESGQYDDFIDELKNMGESSAEEIESMFGELPTKNGIKMTPIQVAQSKISEAKRVKQQTEGLRLLPQLQNIDNNTMSYIRHKLFAQESLRNQIEDLDSKIAEVQLRQHYPIPVENQELTEPELEPQDEFELKELVAKKDELVSSFGEIAQEFKQLIAKPKEAEQQVNDIHEKNIKKAVDNEIKIINKEQDIANEAAKKLEELKKTAEEPIIVQTEQGELNAVMQDGVLVNAETGEPIEEELLSQFKKDVVDEEEIESEETPEEYDETKENTFLTGPQKPSVHATSTRGLDIEYTTTGSKHYARDNQSTGLFEYVLHQAHEIITKWFSNPNNTPSDTKKYTAQLTEVPITQELLDEINNVRASKNNRSSTAGRLPQLTLEDLQLPQYKPLRMWLYENGKLVKASEENAIHFHDVDYFFDTQVYTNIMLDENLSNEAKEIAVNKELAKLIEERTKLVDNLDVAVLTVPTNAGKSNGVLNFLPNLKVGEKFIRRVLPISNLANQEGNYGIGYVKSINEDGVAIIDYNGDDFDSRRKDLKLGALVFDIISANGSHLVNNNITKNKYTPEQIDSIAELLIYKVTSGTDSIKVDGKEFNIKELLRSLIYLGINKNNSESTIAFSKEGDILIVGRDKKIDGKYDNSSKWDKERAIKDRQGLKKALTDMLSTNYHAYPNPDMKLLNQKSNIIVFPTEINELGEAKGDIIPIQDFFLNGKEPMIGTNINPNIPFINSYFNFEINGAGLVFDVKEQQAEPYASNLEGEIPTDSDFGFEETKETTTPVTTDTKADIDLISTPVSKIVEELSKLNTLNEKLNWLKNNKLLSPININGKEYNTIDYSDRVMVLMKIGKYNIPFYISTGQAGKKNVKAGNWYAIFGIGVEKGWINKGSEEQINNNYGFQVFEKLSKILNEGIGVIQSREDNGNGKLKDGIGFLSDSKQDLEAFNNSMNLPTKPAGKNTDTKDFYDHVNSTLSLLNNELKELAALGTDAKADIKKQKELENKVKELEEQRKALRSEDGSIPADKMSEFKRLGEEINKAKKAATRGYSNNSMLIKRFSEGADTSVTDPIILSAEDRKEAANIIEQVIQNSKTAEEALKKIQRFGYIFDISVTQNLKKYLDDRFDQNVPKIGNNKDSFQAWIYGKTDAELDALERKEVTPEENKVNQQLKENEINCSNNGKGIKLNPKPKFNFKK